MNFIGLAIALVLSCSAVGQTGEVSKWEKRRALYPELMSIFDLAQSAPSGLKALALLHVASFPTLKDQEWKRELLQESFETAGRFSVLWPTSYVALPTNPSLTPLPRRVNESVIMNSGLDRLSLQTSAIRQMSRVDPKRADKMFEQLFPLHVPQLTCSSELVPNVDSYFKAADSLAKSELSSSKKKEGFDFVRSVIAGISSPVEIAPAAEMIEKQKVSYQDKDALAVQLAERLETVSGDSRSFLETLDSDDAHISQLVHLLSGETTLSVLKAWRTYLVTNLSGPSCRELTDSNWPYQASVKKAVDSFNRRAADSQGSVAYIEPADVSFRPDSAFPQEKQVQTQEDKELQRDWFALEFGGGRVGLADADKNSAEWQNRFDDYLEAIDKLQSSPGESDLDLIRKKWDLMGAAILIAPAGPVRDTTVERYVSLFKISNMPEEMLPFWYYSVCSLIDLSQKFSKGRSDILKLLKNSHDSLLELVERLSASQLTPDT